LFDGFVFSCDCEACRQDWPLFDLLPTGPSSLLDVDVDISGYKSVDTKSGAVIKQQSVQDQNLLDTFNRVKSKVEQLQASRAAGGGPPSKIMIQNQVRLYRCLLAMYSSKLFTIKTGSGSLPIPV